MMRIGQGIDFHRFCQDRPLILGGVKIEYPLGLKGHSDADVLVHALCDAILGALGLGDIGEHYSDQNLRWKDLDSMVMLGEILVRMQEQGFEMVNLDLVFIGQKPKLSPYKEIIKERLSSAIGIEKERVNIKATTTEGMGDIGRGEGLGASCVVLLQKKKNGILV